MRRASGGSGRFLAVSSNALSTASSDGAWGYAALASWRKLLYCFLLLLAEVCRWQSILGL